MPAEPENADVLAAYIVASARLLDIEIKPEWSESVRANLDVTLKLAKMVASFPLADETEPAPVFEA